MTITREELLNREALIDTLSYPELDRQVAEIIFEWTEMRWEEGGLQISTGINWPKGWYGNNANGQLEYLGCPWSQHMERAMEVVHYMDSLGFWAGMQSPFCSEAYVKEMAAKRADTKRSWTCGFTPHMTSGWNGSPDYYTQAETLPLAICRSALKLMMERRDE